MCVGNPANLTAEARRKEPEARKRIAQSHKANRQGAELARLYKAEGYALRAIASRLTEGGYATRLNSGGYQTRGGKQFKAESVRRLLAVNVAA